MNGDFPDWLARQAGYLSGEEQTRVCAAKAAVLGCGGVGGVAAELLARAGVGRLALCDGGRFDAPDLNRQVGALGPSLGAEKAAVTAERLAGVNPALELTLHRPVGPEGPAPGMLEGCAAAVLAVDDPGAALAAVRGASAAGVPLVEAIALPVVQLRVFMPGGPEPPWPGPDPGLSDGEGAPLSVDAGFALASARGGAAPSLGPLVWLAGALAALEALKIIAGRPVRTAYPGGAALDPCAFKLVRR